MTDLPPSERTRAIWDDFAGRLRAWFRARSRSHFDEDELLQETFLRIHTGLPALRDDEAVGPWVRRIARNVWIDALRGAERSDEAVDPAEVAEASPGEAVAREVASWLDGFLEELSPEDRESLRLADLEGVPQREVAERFGWTASATKSRIQRARTKLRDSLLACCRVELDGSGGVVDYEPRRGDDCAC